MHVTFLFHLNNNMTEAAFALPKVGMEGAKANEAVANNMANIFTLIFNLIVIDQSYIEILYKQHTFIKIILR